MAKKYYIGTDTRYQYHSIVRKSPMSGHQKIITLQLICINTNYFYKMISFECFVNSITYFQKFKQNLYITKLSVCDALKIKVLKSYLNINNHKQTSLKFDDKKYSILAQMHSITVLYTPTLYYQACSLSK